MSHGADKEPRRRAALRRAPDLLTALPSRPPTHVARLCDTVLDRQAINAAINAAMPGSARSPYRLADTGSPNGAPVG